MTQPKRHGSTDVYRYGFQGQEKDDEIKGEGNSLNYKYRMHDPRIGRFFAVDPLSPKYPHYTPYSFSGNKVIAFGELEGLEEIILTETFTNRFGLHFEIMSHSEVLQGYYNAISLESKKDKQIVYFTAYSGEEAIGGRGKRNGYTSKLNSLIEKTNILRVRKGYSKSLNRRYDDNIAKLKENGLVLKDLTKLLEEGKEIFIVALNLNTLESTIQDQIVTLVHEINAKNHLIDKLNGVVSENKYDGHIDYFDLLNHPSGLTEDEIKQGYSPRPKNVYKDSKAGKDISEVNKATYKWMEELKKEFEEEDKKEDEKPISDKKEKDN